MPAGMKYNLNPMGVEKELCSVETIYRLKGGFNLVDTDLSEGVNVPHLAPLAIDFATRRAVVCKNVRVVEEATATATTIKVAKSHLVTVGMFLGTGEKGAEVKSVDKSNKDYDTITFKATAGVLIEKGKVLFQASDTDGITPKNRANFLNYDPTKVEPGASVTAVGTVYEIKELIMPCPVSEKDKESLGHRFMFI